MTEKRTFTEEFEVSGEKLISAFRKLLHESNVRRVILKNEDGRVLIEVPLTFGIAATLLTTAVAAPLAAVGAIAALVAKVTVVVVREEDDADQENE